MCGIAGIIAKNNTGRQWLPYLPAATNVLQQRGPDAVNTYSSDALSFGHCRLIIIDLSAEAAQPMVDESNRYCIIYNGEIFNFRELRKKLESKGVSFQTQSDTEVLLKLYIQYGREMLSLLNGFFAFAIYDSVEKTCFLVRDRFGVKPLFFYEDENCLLFASEMKALLQFPIRREMDIVSLQEYFQLNYIPAPDTIFSSIKKLLPGHSLYYQNGKTTDQCWYTIPSRQLAPASKKVYASKQQELFDLMEDAVKIRLVSDVPLGTFLSGGIDSSIISGLASKHIRHLKTFSIGYKEEGFFDETYYAKSVAKHFNTDHTVFTLSRNQLYESLFEVLDYFDEPFGDSSALPVYLLSKLTRKEVKVALSGDGADELFGGYLKHNAEYRARNAGLAELAVSSFHPVLKLFSSSRNSEWTNRVRQLLRFSEGMKLSEKERYWKWCSIAAEDEVKKILSVNTLAKDFYSRKETLTRFIHLKGDLNEVLMNDIHLVLPNDMLVKVDSMSMANGLEVRTPFLDYRVVEFACFLPSQYKVNARYRKMIVQDAFRKFLPAELYHRPKRGFEIPLHGFLTRELKSLIEAQYLSKEFIHAQNIFNYEAVRKLKQKLFSMNPEDSAARVWGLIVFQHWWKKWME
ncbi:MAG TPA: asparagine synthase (glutamine-hydrolyzing) [Chitinophagales bacterium]|nr:asparagine synthase (glutamine-hydrolyzing) [Chitinophagales bacterium]